MGGCGTRRPLAFSRYGEKIKLPSRFTERGKKGSIVEAEKKCYDCGENVKKVLRKENISGNEYHKRYRIIEGTDAINGWPILQRRNEQSDIHRKVIQL